MTIYRVRVIPNSKKTEVIQEAGCLKVRVNAPAADGKANKALISALAGFFGVKRRSIRIVRGEKSKEKVVCIDNAVSDYNR